MMGPQELFQEFQGLFMRFQGLVLLDDRVVDTIRTLGVQRSHLSVKANLQTIEGDIKRGEVKREKENGEKKVRDIRMGLKVKR
ncbi:hypothetical protein TorRG33x02_182910 [Trema orientale]|uniref:Uncharacterized protein n=1 Tax=Trema orientale TaxID=63057 RepID=A0A2P5EK59_TREOI|nr:hypothetical protein TorRG33x02_182910 [Trema orientale]